MSKITIDSLTRSGIGCFVAVPMYGNSGRQRVKMWELIDRLNTLSVLVRSDYIAMSLSESGRLF